MSVAALQFRAANCNPHARTGPALRHGRAAMLPRTHPAPPAVAMQPASIVRPAAVPPSGRDCRERTLRGASWCRAVALFGWWRGARQSNRRSGASRAHVFGPRPRTAARSARLRNGPCVARCATMRPASTGPTPGRRCKSLADARLMRSGALGSTSGAAARACRTADGSDAEPESAGALGAALRDAARPVVSMPIGGSAAGAAAEVPSVGIATAGLGSAAFLVRTERTKGRWKRSAR